MYLGLSRIKVTIWLVIVTMVTSAMLYKGYSAFGTLGESWLPIVLKTYGFFIALWAAYMLLAFRFHRKAARCINREWGTVEAMGHSKVRVGKEWLIDILVSYGDQQQEIKCLEPEFQFRYPQGSRIPLKVNPDKPEEVVVDYAVIRGEVEPVKDTGAVNSALDNSAVDLQKIIADASATAINEVSGGAIAANAQVKSLTESEEKGRYSLTLQVFSDQYESPYEVVKQMKIPSNLIAKLMPGSFVQCRIDRADKNAVSLVFHDVTEI
jgi:hypothetical protein